MKNRNGLLGAVVVSLAAILVFSSLLYFDVRAASDFPQIYVEELEYLLPQAWNTTSAAGFGEYGLLTLWTWPVGAVYYIFYALGGNYSMLLRFVNIFPAIILGFWGMYKLLGLYKAEKNSRLLAGLFYVTTTYFLLLLDGGQLTIALAYSLLPLTYYFTLKYLKFGFSKLLIPALLVGLLGYLDIRYVYLIFVLYFLQFLYDLILLNDRRKVIVAWAKYVLICLVILFLLNFYWLIIAIVFKPPSLPTSYGDLSQLSFLNFGGLLHSFTLHQPHWYLNIFGNISKVGLINLILPIVIFLTPVFVRKNKNVGFWMIVALVGIFLSKGAMSPVGGIYEFLFAKLPGFNLFRDPTKFYVFISLSFSVLLSLFLTKLEQNSRRIFNVFFIGVVIYTILLTFPVWTNKMTGLFSEPVYQSEYENLSNLLQSDPNYSRVLWIPSRPPLGYSSDGHPTLEASRLSNIGPFTAGIVGSYETFNFLRDAPHTGELMDVSSVGYLVYPFPDDRRNEMKSDNVEYYNYFSDQIESLPWIEEKISNSPVGVYKTKTNQDEIFVASNMFYVVGSDRIYWDLLDISGFKLSDNALIFVEELPDVVDSFSDGAKVILFDKTIDDLKMALVRGDQFFFPADDLEIDPDEFGWWKRNSHELVNWRTFLQEKYGIDSLDYDYGGGWAVAEGELEKTFYSDKFGSGDVVYVRAMNTTKSGELELSQKGKLIGSYETVIDQPSVSSLTLHGLGGVEDEKFEYEDGVFRWKRIGVLISDGEITIKSSGEVNAIQAIVSISPDGLARIEQEIDNINDGKILDWEDVTDQQRSDLFVTDANTIVDFTKVSPTSYTISISGLEDPSTVIFSSSFDEFWKLDGQGASKVYSLLNGFFVSEDGEYELQYAPQKYLQTGFVISAVGLMVILAIITIPMVKQKLDTDV